MAAQRAVIPAALINQNAATLQQAANWLFNNVNPRVIVRNAVIGGNAVRSAKVMVSAQGWTGWLPMARGAFMVFCAAKAIFHGFDPRIGGNNVCWASATIRNLRRPFVGAGMVGMAPLPGQLHVNRRYAPPMAFLANVYQDFRASIWRFTVSVPQFDVTDVTIKWTNIVAGGMQRRVRVKQGVASRSVIHVRPFEDNLCAQRALILLMFYHRRNESEEHKRMWTLIKDTRDKKEESKACRTLTQMAEQLSVEARVDPRTPCDFYDLSRLQAAVSARMGRVTHIQVFSAEMHMNLIFSTLPEGVIGPDFDSIVWLNLIMNGSHYIPAKKIHKILHNQRKYCYRCKKTYTKTHKCKHKCTMCGHDVDHFALYRRGGTGLKWKFCADCGRNFYGKECFQMHISSGTCQRVWKCTTCKKLFRYHPEDQKMRQGVVNRDEHVCGTFYCAVCKSYVAKDHKCYMRATEPKETSELYLFADFEATQETGVHKVNLAVTQDHNGEQWPLFKTVRDWVDYLLNGEWWGYTVVFHNGKGYDFHFIMKEIIARRDFKYQIDPVMVGAKILYFTLSPGKRFSEKKGIRFVDSLNFLPMALKKFTKTFGLTTKKGFYPHFFNTPSNERYVGPIPAEHFFGAESMDDGSYAQFKEWYDERAQETWDNYKELVEYCVADVQLLREGCLAFRSLVMGSTVTGHDPFRHITLASSAMGLFRSEMLEEETIGAFSSRLARELKPALAGGRTGATKLYYKAQPGERIMYVDFTSAYPYVCKNGIYPKGHPVEIVPEPGSALAEFREGDALMSEGASIWCVDIRCPLHLYHPLLHFKDPESGLLLFDLQDKTKAMYTNFELIEAIRLGYVITKVHKIYHWPETIQGVFKDYINIFLKMKQQAGGWPREDMTAEEKAAYIQEYKDNEGIDLDPSQIEKNPGKYHVAKLYLNSLWGKFGQRLGEHFTSTHIIHDSTDGVLKFNKLMASDELKDVLIVNEHSVILTCDGRKVSDHICHGGTNIALAVFTTAWARLKLYKELIEPLGPRICYYDTDSAVFVTRDSELDWLNRTVPLGKYLGDVTNELGHNKYTYEGTYITEFVSGGPKNYGYLTTSDEKVAKIKGHSVKKRNIAKYLNFEAIKDAVLHSTEFLVDNKSIVRDDGFELVNKPGTKVYRFNFMKRRTLAGGGYNAAGELYKIETVPWCNQFKPVTTTPPTVESIFAITANAQALLGDDTASRKRGLPVYYCVALVKEHATDQQTIQVLGTSADDIQEQIASSDHLIRIEGFTSFNVAQAYLRATTEYKDSAMLSAEENLIMRIMAPLLFPSWILRTGDLVLFTNCLEHRETIIQFAGRVKVVFVQA